MSEWLSPREIADMRLPGLGHSVQAVHSRAFREGWKDARSGTGEPLCRARQGRGGGFEFHISLLPTVARMRLEARAGKTRPAEESDQDAALLKARDLSRRDARLFVLSRADEFHRAHPDLNRRQADEGYSALYNSGAGQAPDWVRRMVKALSRPTLERWRSLRTAGRLDLVAGRYSMRQGAQAIERMKGGEVATFIGALIVKQPFLNAAHVRAIVEGRFGEELGEMPSERTFQRFMAGWRDKNALALRKLTDPDGYKSSARLSGNNSNAHVTALNQLWEIDASPADVLTTDGRHAVYVAVDIFSRRMMTLVTKTPRTEATLLLIRRAILVWGVPQTIKTDNGSDFTSQRFVAAMNSVGIAHDVSAPFSPEQKGTVERAIGSLQRGLMTLLDGFIGHSVADRKKIEGRKAFAARLGETDEGMFQVSMTAAELQDRCDKWCEEFYAHRPHAGLNGETPFTRAQSYRGLVSRIENERALDLLLQVAGWRQATKQGLRLDNGWFISPHLLPGMRVFCRQDPEDMGRLHCFESEAGAFITTAICPERAGIDPKAAIKAARERQSEIIAERSKEVRSAARKIKPRDMVDWLQQGARRKSAALTAFPQRGTAHDSAALSAAADAAAADGAPLALPVVQASVEAGNVVAMPETPRRRFTRAVKLEQAIEAGDTIDTAEALWLGGYQKTPEYRSHKAMLEDYGPEAVLENG